MKILIIGGTGTISSAITRQLVAAGHDVWLLNRGSRNASLPEGVNVLVSDIHDEEKVQSLLGDTCFDAVCEFIGFVPADVERDIRLFSGRTRQYVFISSASTYNKPVRNYLITEGTSQANPYSQYAREKMACEAVLMKAYREQGFPVTIIRPSHTYSETGIPTSVRGLKGGWPIAKRMIEGKPVIIQGDGSSLWTMTWCEDFASGFIGLLDNPKAIGEAFQITSDESLTWNQIYQAIADALGVELKAYHVSSDFLAAVSPKEWKLEANLTGDKAATVVFDCSKLKRAVPGYCASTRFSEGVRKSVAYMLAHPELQVEEPDYDAWCDRVIEAIENTKKSFIQQ